MLCLDFSRVSRSFTQKIALYPFTASLKSGHIYAITGSNGSGKSTLLLLAARLLKPTEGEVSLSIQGKPVSEKIWRAQTALLAPTLTFYAQLTARENLRFFLALRDIHLQRAQETSLLARVGLSQSDMDAKRVQAFSTGMQQRLKLATLLGMQANLWLWDEPCANLDAAGRQLFWQEARAAAKRDTLILWATNDDEEAQKADAILAVRDPSRLC